MQLIFPLIILLFSSGYVIFLRYIAQSSDELQRAIVVPIVLIFILILFFRHDKKEWDIFFKKWGKQFFLLWGTIFTQMLVISTGGLQSPFLILIYLFMVVVSFIFSFSLAILFFGISLAVIFITLSFSQDIATYLIQNPTSTILHIVPLITIIPLAFLISRHYHLRELVFSSLHVKVKTDEAIMKHLQELIIITDAKLIILSVNDAVEQTLQKSRSELLGHQIFNVLMLRDQSGKLATKETFFPHGNTTKPPKNVAAPFSLFFTVSPQQEVTVQVQSTKSTAHATSQISFILSSLHEHVLSKDTLTTSLEKTRAKYEALSEHMRLELQKTHFFDLIAQDSIMREIENDMYYVQFFRYHPAVGTISNVDTAKLIKQTVETEQAFAKAFHIVLDFSIKNFSEKDVAPLTVKNYPILPDQFTGPFFTVKTDVRRFELLIKKLFDIAIFLSSGKKDSKVAISIQRGTRETVIVTVNAPSEVPQEVLSDVFIPYYGRLYEKSHLREGSGFEGFLVRTIADMLSYTLDATYSVKPHPEVTFTLTVTKKIQEDKG